MCQKCTATGKPFERSFYFLQDCMNMSNESSGLQVIKLFVLNSTEDAISTPHKSEMLKNKEFSHF